MGKNSVRISPQTLYRPARPFGVIGISVDTAVGAGLGLRRQDIAGGGQGLRVHVLGRIPEFRAHDGAGALEIDRLDIDDDDRTRRLALFGETVEQCRVDAELGAAVDPQCGAGTGDQEQQADARVADDVAERVDAVVAAPVGDHQRAFVVNTHEPLEVAAR